MIPVLDLITPLLMIFNDNWRSLRSTTICGAEHNLVYCVLLCCAVQRVKLIILKKQLRCRLSTTATVNSCNAFHSDPECISLDTFSKFWYCSSSSRGGIFSWKFTCLTAYMFEIYRTAVYNTWSARGSLDFSLWPASSVHNLVVQQRQNHKLIKSSGAMSRVIRLKITDVSGTICPHHQGDDGGSKHIWNVCKLLPDYTVQHHRRQSSSYSPPWKPKISSDPSWSIKCNGFLEPPLACWTLRYMGLL
jgi:hypothetical protein